MGFCRFYVFLRRPLGSFSHQVTKGVFQNKPDSGTGWASIRSRGFFPNRRVVGFDEPDSAGPSNGLPCVQGSIPRLDSHD